MVGSPVWPRRGREGEKHTLGLVEFGSVGAATALRCAALLSDVVGTKARSGRVVARRNGKGNRMSA